jgi:hypothetical protein
VADKVVYVGTADGRILLPRRRDILDEYGSG